MKTLNLPRAGLVNFMSCSPCPQTGPCLFLCFLSAPTCPSQHDGWIDKLCSYETKESLPPLGCFRWASSRSSRHNHLMQEVAGSKGEPQKEGWLLSLPRSLGPQSVGLFFWASSVYLCKERLWLSPWLCW